MEMKIYFERGDDELLFTYFPFPSDKIDLLQRLKAEKKDSKYRSARDFFFL